MSILRKIQHRWPLLYVVITLAVSGMMLVAFAELARQTVFRQTMNIFDNMLIGLIRYHATPRLDQVMIITTSLSYGYIYGVFVIISLALLAIWRRWWELRVLVICLLGAHLLNELLKLLFHRARPDALRLVEAAGYSFPSGHAMVALCFYGMIAFLIARNISSWYWRFGVTISSCMLIIGIGVSRIYLGVHYPSDVLAGYAAGATWLLFLISLLMWWEQKRMKHMDEDKL